MLFENFQGSEENMVVGVISEGTDVAVFSMEQAMEIKNHLDSITSDYYLPFYEKVKPGDKYIFIDTNQEYKPGKFTVQLLTEDQMRDLAATKDIAVYYQNGDEDGTSMQDGYVIELVGGNKYMSIQSWGQTLEDGAFEHFKSFASDEF